MPRRVGIRCPRQESSRRCAPASSAPLPCSMQFGASKADLQNTGGSYQPNMRATGTTGARSIEWNNAGADRHSGNAGIGTNGSRNPLRYGNQEGGEMTNTVFPRTQRIGIFVYPNFEPIDVWGFAEPFSIARFLGPASPPPPPYPFVILLTSRHC